MTMTEHQLAVTAETPIHHGAFEQSIGNESQFRRIPTVYGRVPGVHGNSFRGVMRRVVMRDLLDLCAMSIEDGGWDQIYACLANGGHLVGSESSIDPAYIRELRRAVPQLSVFGSMLMTWSLSGRMHVHSLVLRCSELGTGDTSFDDLVAEDSMVRHVDRELQDPEVTGVTPMPTTLEVVKQGAVFDGRIRFFDRPPTPYEAPCIGWALNQIKAVGGKAASGYGAVRIDHDIDHGPYADWRETPHLVAAARDALIELAGNLVGSKGKKKGKKAADVSPADSAS